MEEAHHAFVDDVEAGIAEGGLDGVGAIPLLEDIFVAEHAPGRGSSAFMAQCTTSIQ